jgi:hypothetical protein
MREHGVPPASEHRRYVMRLAGHRRIANRVSPVVDTMQPPSIDPALYGTFAQSHLLKLSKGHNPVLILRNRCDPPIQSPTGRFLTIRVGNRPVGKLSDARRHWPEASSAEAHV